MTKVYIADTTHSITVDEAVYTVTVASAASDTTVATSGSGTSLINTSAGGIHTLNSLTAGANITLTDDDAGNLTIAATEDNLTNNDTDDLSEGSTNQYFTDARVMTSLETVSGHVLPSADITYDLGSSAKQWRDVYVGPGSLYVNGQQLLSTEPGIVNLTTDPSENLNVQAGGTITMLSTGAVTTMQDATVNLGPADNSGTINARGDLNVAGTMDIDTADIGTLTHSGIKISNSAGNIELETNATGYVHADAADLYVGPLAGAVKIDEGSITTTAGDLTISATGSVDVAGHYTSTETDTAISTAVSNLVDSAPATLDTLNELAAALGDDANFSTTVTNSIATKWTQDNTKISNWDTAYSWGDHSTEGYLTSFTETNDLTSAVTWANVPDANITQSSVTQHQAALSITESQITDLTHYTDTDARTAISLTTDSASLTYNSTTGAFVYTDPTGSPGPASRIQIDVRNQTGSTITAGSAVYISGTSGNNELITLADADGTNPAMGIVVSDISNNSNGVIVTNGEVTGIDTSAYAVNDTLYLSSTAGALTTTRPSSANQIVQNIARVVKVHAVNGIIVVQGSGRANDVPNLDHKDVFIGNTTGYEVRNLTTADITEDASKLFFTDARAISAVEGEDTLNFSEVTANDLSVRATGTINNETQHWPYYETFNEYYHLPLAEIPAALGGNSPAITAQSYNVTTGYLVRDADNNVDSSDVMTLTHQYDMDLSGNSGNELSSSMKFDVADELGEHPVADVFGQTRNSTYGGSDRKTVEGVALTDPCQITSTGHGLSDDDIIRISQVNGTTELNDRLFKVTNTATDTFELKEKHPTPGWGWQDCDATGYSTYTDDDEGLIKNSYVDEFTGEIILKTWNKTGPAENNNPTGNLDQHEVLTASSDKVEVKSPFQFASYTTTERDALSVSNGTTIYNETTDKFQGYAGGSWVDLH